MDKLRIISLGGFGKVTQNLFVYHFLPQTHSKHEEILLVDCGAGFPRGDLFGVDLVVPDVDYLRQQQEKIVGLILTHAHEDHIGALPFVLPQFKTRFPIWANKLTAALVEDKLNEVGIRWPIRIFDEETLLRLGSFEVVPIRVTHSIPDNFHFYIRTPVGNFYHGGDFKLDFTPLDGKLSQLGKIAAVGREGVVCALLDCLGIETEFTPAEVELSELFVRLFKQAKGAVFVTAISSNIYRWQQAIEGARATGRKVTWVGMSVEKIIKIAKRLGYLHLGRGETLPLPAALKIPRRRVTFLVAGSLGQTGSSLERIILEQHEVKIKPGDLVIFSSPDYIPGTTEAIYNLINRLAQKGIEVVWGEVAGRLHVSGHGGKRDIATLISLLTPHYLLPIGGEFRHQQLFAAWARQLGFSSSQIITPEENQGITFWADGRVSFDIEIKRREVFVDGLGVGDVGNVVLRDRQQLAKEGILVIILLVDNRSKKLIEDPVVVSRGFVYVKQSKRLLSQIQQQVKKEYQKFAGLAFETRLIRQEIQGHLEEFVLRKTGRQPMVLPVLIEV